MNIITLIGRLTADPELRFIPNSGTAIGKFNLAVNREFKKEGQPTADFFIVKSFGKTAENMANFLQKGRLVAVTGRLQNNNYEDKNGVKHYGNEVMAQRIEFLEWGDSNNNQGQQQQTQQRPQQQQRQQPAPQQSYQQNSPQHVNNQPSNMNGFQPIDNDDDIPF
jgi:single-strand DNA-binding protein